MGPERIFPLDTFLPHEQYQRLSFHHSPLNLPLQSPATLVNMYLAPDNDTKVTINFPRSFITLDIQ